MLTILASFLVISSIIAVNRFISIRKEVKDMTEQIAARLSISLVYPIWNFEDLQIGSLIGIEMTNSGTLGIYIRDPKNRILSACVRFNSALVSTPTETEYPVLVKTASKRVVKNIYYQKQWIGSVEVFTSDRTLLMNMGINLLVIFGCIMLILPVILLSTYWIIRKTVIRPILLLSQAVDDFSRHQYDKPIQLKGQNELGKLVKNFNEMAETIDRYNRDLRNMVEEKTAETIQAIELLAQSEKMASLGNMVSGIAHEINTPVGIGVTAASFLSMKTKEFAEIYSNGDIHRSDLESYLENAKESSNIILSNLERASDLIQSFKRVAVNQTLNDIHDFNVRSYLNDILNTIHPRLKKTTHRVEIDCPEDLVINSSPGAFSQILTNLIINSLIHAFDEGESGLIRIQIHFREAEKLLEILYTDNGKGIPQENMKLIFTPFFTTKRGQGGTGLGLNIVFGVVTQQLKGSIQCESVPGTGVKFIIKIPLISEGN
jgi:signal transduction histidine kinase